MSSVIALYSTSGVIIGTDTLTSSKADNGEFIPLPYTCKVFQLPQFKSCFAVTGTQKLGLSFYQFATEKVMGTAIDSLVNIDLKHYMDYRSEREETDEMTGSIYLFGFSENDKIFKVFKFDPTEKIQWTALEEDGALFIPGVEDYEVKLASKNEQFKDEYELIKQLMLIQKEEDEARYQSERVGIGGEMVISALSLYDGDKFFSQTIIYHQFEDFLSPGNDTLHLKQFPPANKTPR